MEQELLPVDERHAQYKRLLKSMPFSPEHYEQLLDRGLNNQQVVLNGYRSWQTGTVDREGLSLSYGLPGMYYNVAEGAVVTGKEGLAIPVRDYLGRIRAIKLRPDDGEPKYMWLSSRGKRGGCSPGTQVHHTLPPIYSRGGKVLWITEGPLKADVASHLSGFDFIGLPSVNPPAGWIDEVKLYFKPWQKKRVVIALDADWRTNPQVRKARNSIGEQLYDHSFFVRFADWNIERGKGVDDLLLSVQQQTGR